MNTQLTFKNWFKYGVALLVCMSISFCTTDDATDDMEDMMEQNDNNSGSLSKEQQDFIDKIKAKYPTQVIKLITDFGSVNAPYVKDQKVNITISSSGKLFIDPAPLNPDNKELELDVFTIEGSEYVWKDVANNLKYALSLKADGSLHEVNVNRLTDGLFYSQLIENGVTGDSNGGDSGEKSTTTTFRFKESGVDCTPFDQSRNKIVALVHINTEKCNGETFRPTLSLNFKFGIDIKPGIYTVTESTPTTDNTVRINSASYNFTNWLATEGTVEVTVNSEDSEKIDIELKSIKMRNENPNDNNDTPSDILTGFIIKV